MEFCKENEPSGEVVRDEQGDGYRYRVYLDKETGHAVVAVQADTESGLAKAVENYSEWLSGYVDHDSDVPPFDIIDDDDDGRRH